MTDEQQPEAIEPNTDANGFPVFDEKNGGFGYVGLKKVKNAEALMPGPFVLVTFEDDTTVRLHAHVYDIILTEQAIEADMNDLIYLCLAKELLAQLVEYDLLSFQVTGVASNMVNLTENSHNSATRKLWGNKSNSQVSLQEIKKVLEQS